MLLPFFGHLAHHFTGLSILYHGAQWQLDHLVLAAGTTALVAIAHLAFFGDHVLGVAQVKQRPQLSISPNDDVATTPAIAAIRATFGHVLLPPKVATAFAPLTGAAFDADMVNEVHWGAKVAIGCDVWFLPSAKVAGQRSGNT